MKYKEKNNLKLCAHIKLIHVKFMKGKSEKYPFKGTIVADSHVFLS